MDRLSKTFLDRSNLVISHLGYNHRKDTRPFLAIKSDVVGIISAPHLSGTFGLAYPIWEMQADRPQVTMCVTKRILDLARPYSSGVTYWARHSLPFG